MRFISKDIKENKPLRSFIRTKVRPRGEVFKTIVLDNYLYNIYDTKHVIRDIEKLIAIHEKGTNSTCYIPRWRGYIKTLQELKQSSLDA